MSTFAELRAVLIRQAVGIRGFVYEREARAILDWCGDLLTVRYSRFAQEGQYRRREDGGFNVTVPIGSRDDEDAFAQLHEVGHGFLDLPPPENDLEREFEPVRIGRLGQSTVLRDEGENRVFLDALRLPRRLVSRYLKRAQPDLSGLIEDSGCEEAMIRRRVEWIRSHPMPQRTTIPSWAAVHEYRLWERRTEFVRALVIEPKREGPSLEFPCRNAAESLFLRNQLSGSLYALRPHEFRLKFTADEARRSDALVMWHEWVEEQTEAWW
jgi:hypothetical protein